MKKSLIILFVLFAVSLYAKSGIRFDKLEHDFGTVQEGTVVKFTFTFKNTGDSALVIDRVRVSCGCTNTNLSTQVLNPGEQGSLEISFDSDGYSGSITRVITVLTNDPANEAVRLKIKANVTGAGDK